MSANMTVTLRGRIGTDVKEIRTATGRTTTRFRLATPRWRINDRAEFDEQEPQWYTIRAWDKLAHNMSTSFAKGHPIVLTGRPSVNAWKDEAGEVKSERVIVAHSAGHDLNYGWSHFDRPKESRPEGEAERDDGGTGNLQIRTSRDDGGDAVAADAPAAQMVTAAV